MPFLSVPDSLRSVDVQVGGRAVRGLLVLAAVVIAVLAGRWWWVQQGAEAVPVERVQVLETTPTGGGEPPTGTAPADAGPVTDGAAVPAQPVTEAATVTDTVLVEGQPVAAAADQAGEGPPTGSLFVHVIGQVRKPGVVELPPGARVVDAVEAAGGFTDTADQSSVNLARGVLDGEQVWVAAPGEEPPPGLAPAPAPPGAHRHGTGAGASAAGAPGTGGTAQEPARVDLNRATQPDLEALPGVGPVTAGRILAWREEHGRFTTVEELMEVSGIGERTFAQLEPLVLVGN